MIHRATVLTFLLLNAWWGAACSTTPVSSAPKSPEPAPQVTMMCFGTPPPTWANAISSGIPLPIAFGPAAIDDADHRVFGYLRLPSGHGIAAVDTRTAAVTMIAAFPPTASGVSWIAYSKPWLAWVQGESVTVIGAWSVHIANLETGEGRELATSALPDGTYLTGQLTFPVVGPGYLAWTQPVSRQSLDERVLRLDTGEQLTLDAGRVSSPVIAGRYLVWAKQAAPGGEAELHAVDSQTLRPVSVPASWREPRPITYLAGSPDSLLVESDSHSLAVLPVASGPIRTFTEPTGDVRHPLQFPMLAGHFLAWFAATTDSVVDLTTGGGFDVPLPGAIAAAGSTIAIARIQQSKVPGSAASTALAIIAIRAMGGIPKCAR